jgi:hypothetical protein
VGKTDEYALTEEFQEIGHCGGKVTFHFRTDPDGRRGYQMQYSGSRPVPMVLIGIYALYPGIPLGRINMGGIGQPWNAPPLAECLAVMVGSDSQGKFGHQCPSCKGYWRSGPWANVCPYCGIRAEDYQFLSEAQHRYIRHYCETLTEGMQTVENGDVVIDMDIVAEAAGKEGPKPAFYISEQSQQRKFDCAACGEYNDILGRYGYCSACGTRNDLQDFESQIVPSLRASLNNAAPPEDVVKDAVGAFDTFVGQYAKQMAALVPMTKQRAARLTKQRFHQLSEVRDMLRGWFDIDICGGIDDGDVKFLARMFLRRHVYEHNGGEVDQVYLDASGDTTVRLKQHIRETREDVHRLVGLLQRLATNLHGGFHELFPPVEGPIKDHKEKLARMAQYQNSQRR